MIFGPGMKSAGHKSKKNDDPNFSIGTEKQNIYSTSPFGSTEIIQCSRDTSCLPIARPFRSICLFPSSKNRPRSEIENLGYLLLCLLLFLYFVTDPCMFQSSFLETYFGYQNLAGLANLTNHSIVHVLRDHWALDVKYSIY